MLLMTVFVLFDSLLFAFVSFGIFHSHDLLKLAGLKRTEKKVSSELA